MRLEASVKRRWMRWPWAGVARESGAFGSWWCETLVPLVYSPSVLQAQCVGRFHSGQAPGRALQQKLPPQWYDVKRYMTTLDDTSALISLLQQPVRWVSAAALSEHCHITFWCLKSKTAHILKPSWTINTQEEVSELLLNVFGSFGRQIWKPKNKQAS